MRHSRSVLLAFMCTVGLVSRASAQGAEARRPEARGPEIGSRVRVFAPDLRGDRYIGRIASLDGSVMVLDTAEVRTVLGIESGPVLVDQYRRVTIRLAAIESIDVSGGRTVGGATAKGSLFGSLVGAVLFGLGSMPEVNPDARDFVKGMPVGLAVGAVVGAVVGWGVGGERWLPTVVPR